MDIVVVMFWLFAMVAFLAYHSVNHDDDDLQ